MRDVGLEPWGACPLCDRGTVAHDRTHYGQAFAAAAVILLHEAGATPGQIDLIVGALGV